MTGTDRQELRTVAIALLASLLLWNLPFGGVLLYPFKLFATWLHEMSHGLVMLVTGNGLDRVVIYRDTSGLAHASDQAGPTALAFIAAAGYMGTSLWGALLLVVTPTARAARNAMLVLAGLLAISAMLVIATPKDDSFGLWAVGGMSAAVAAAAIVLRGRWRIAVAHFIAAQSCVNALLDIRVLFRPEQIVNGIPAESDAHSMARATFGTTDQWALWFWAIVWLVWALVVLYVAMRISAQSASGSRALANVAPFGRPTASPPDGSDRDERRRSPETEPERTAPSGPADTAGS
ncbi:MAG: M50 family metallopeptidase [Deltaproteobacteria bacterium]|nr:M50 family metallopeptidase [Deltaproteobacteria bacterium]